MPLTLFHGDLDKNALLPSVARAAALLPNARLIVLPNEAHLSTLCNHFGAIAEALA
jgi:pimeloyl-ACP methyl ester carboxylesterase